jgi:hypothetical protein
MLATSDVAIISSAYSDTFMRLLSVDISCLNMGNIRSDPIMFDASDCMSRVKEGKRVRREQ